MIRYCTATLSHVEQILEWAAAEGWNPGQDDAAAFYAADPEGFFVALEGNAPVAAISVVNHSDSFAFLGLYICLPSHRGQGIGMALWTHALTHAGERTVGLDGVPAQQANYEASGFVRTGKTTRYEGPLPPISCADVRQARETDIPILAELEATASGWPKPRYLSTWLKGADTRRSWVLEQGGAVAGFATVRRCRVGRKIGPFWATSAPEANRLLSHLAVEAPGPLIIDVPASSSGLDALCRQLGLAPGFETARMYRGPANSTSHPFFGVSTLELG